MGEVERTFVEDIGEGYKYDSFAQRGLVCTLNLVADGTVWYSSPYASKRCTKSLSSPSCISQDLLR